MRTRFINSFICRLLPLPSWSTSRGETWPRSWKKPRRCRGHGISLACASTSPMAWRTCTGSSKFLQMAVRQFAYNGDNARHTWRQAGVVNSLAKPMYFGYIVRPSRTTCMATGLGRQDVPEVRHKKPRDASSNPCLASRRVALHTVDLVPISCLIYR